MTTAERVRKNDGGWHALASQVTTERNYGRVWRAVIARYVEGAWQYDHCPHRHRRRVTADGCAERAAKRLNRHGGVMPADA